VESNWKPLEERLGSTRCAGFMFMGHHLQFPERPVSPLGFLVMPPWYQKPRFEVTLLLTIAAGTLFSACRGLCHVWRERDRAASVEMIQSLRRRLTTAASVAALAGFNLAIATWLR
jgi:hypothetical protein